MELWKAPNLNLSGTLKIFEPSFNPWLLANGKSGTLNFDFIVTAGFNNKTSSWFFQTLDYNGKPATPLVALKFPKNPNDLISLQCLEADPTSPGDELLIFGKNKEEWGFEVWTLSGIQLEEFTPILKPSFKKETIQIQFADLRSTGELNRIAGGFDESKGIWEIEVGDLSESAFINIPLSASPSKSIIEWSVVQGKNSSPIVVVEKDQTTCKVSAFSWKGTPYFYPRTLFDPKTIDPESIQFFPNGKDQVQKQSSSPQVWFSGTNLQHTRTFIKTLTIEGTTPKFSPPFPTTLTKPIDNPWELFPIKMASVNPVDGVLLGTREKETTEYLCEWTLSPGKSVVQTILKNELEFPPQVFSGDWDQDRKVDFIFSGVDASTGHPLFEVWSSSGKKITNLTSVLKPQMENVQWELITAP